MDKTLCAISLCWLVNNGSNDAPVCHNPSDLLPMEVHYTRDVAFRSAEVGQSFWILLNHRVLYENPDRSKVLSAQDVLDRF